MSGLYQKALVFFQERQQLRPVRREEAKTDEELDISPEEREKVLAQIDKIVARNRIEIKPDTFSFTPKRSGRLLPFLINGVALATIVGGIFLSSFFFNRREESIVTRPTAITTAEGKLIDVLRQEAEQQLNQKEREISDIQSKLAVMNSEREKLRAESEAQIHQREGELREALARELDVERQKLQSGGLSKEMIEQQIRALEEEKRKEHEQQIESLKKQADQELAEKQDTIAVLINDYEQVLNKAQNERLELQDELAARQAELQAQFEERESALESDRARAVEQLNQIRRQQEREQLILDQILSSYDTINEYIKAAQYNEALANLATLRDFINQDSVAMLPGIMQRRHVELFIIRSLKELIENELVSDSQDTESLIASANLIASVSSIIEQGNSRFQEGDYPSAQEIYLSALAEIPVIDVGYGKLKEIEEMALQQEQRELAEIIAAGNAYYLDNNFRKAVEQYGKALEYLQGDIENINQMVLRIMDSGYRINAADDLARLRKMGADEAERKAMLTRLGALREQYAGLTDSAEQSSAEAQEALLALLETKLLLKQVIDSETVRHQYPELYDKTERYFEAFAEEKSKDAQHTTLKDINALLDTLTNRENGENFPEVFKRYEEPSQRELLLRFIDKLQILLQ